jgi:hypothetical protein
MNPTDPNATTITITASECASAVAAIAAAAAVGDHDVEEVLGEFLGADVAVSLTNDGIELETLRFLAFEGVGCASVSLLWKVGQPTVLVTLCDFGAHVEGEKDVPLHVALSGDGRSICYGLVVNDDHLINAKRASQDMRAALSRLCKPAE